MIKAMMNTETLLSWTRLLPSFQPPFFIQLWTRINSNIFISDNLSRFPWSKAGNICVLILHSVDGANSGRKKKKEAPSKVEQVEAENCLESLLKLLIKRKSRNY